MGQGYHSRSPEEFRDFLKSIDQKSRKLKWKQLIIIIDIMLLLFVFYLVFRALNPGSFQDPTQSAKQIIDGNSAYLSLSREKEDDFQGYFLFFENTSREEIIIPKTDWIGEFRILNKEGVLCYSEKLNWEPRKILSGTKGFLYHSVSLKKLKEMDPVCKKEVFDENYSFFRSKFSSLGLGFFSQVVVSTPNRNYIFQIKQKPYREDK
ncbi:hypothetical protein [Leptospira ilyithenensis]|uniref:Uncharacterized protein n=1 Tax=Leptospira ilyithenensis TaxID=2484901 RepID=A0A4R9LS05_9LEPT|nr:hypothetical protein [Leptospira ilyithenensis]TGN13997.1 hypothetical protein EHS11_03160 [Leptospira ilyithenensis]